MTPERWQQVKTALDQMLDVLPASRSAMLAEICSGDEDLRSEVESLLVFENSANVSFTQPKLAAAIQEVLADSADGFIGKQIGKYKILQEIGMGGMGAVYLATRTDGEFEQQVAIKFLRQSFSSAAARQRFAQERQILARLQHRFIAQLIDGGTTEDGTPYLAMEYVQGISITDYCSKNNLPIRKKLDLFRNVCEAVSFAHRNLIVHRDLKPDNILITTDGVPKLLDFGIAKLLSATEVKATITHHQALTPEYASPEQLAGHAITTASDVYALGIILYELLTEIHPFKRRKMSSEQVWQAVIVNEPIRPSAVITRKHKAVKSPDDTIHPVENKLQTSIRKILKGDLDTITLKALRKEPERRYESVELFSRDIKSYLKGFPISARPDTFRYRTGKFFLRNPLASIAVFVAAVSLIGGIFIAVYQARRADAERIRAERRFNEVRSLANSFMFEIDQKIDESPIKARELIATRAVEYLDNLSQEAGSDENLQSELATSYEKIGDLQSSIFAPTLGKPSESLASHRKALAIREKLFAKDETNVERGLAVASSLMKIGDALMTNGNVTEARNNYALVIQLDERLLKIQPDDEKALFSLARNYSRLGQSVLRSGSLGEAENNYLKALDTYQILERRNPSERRVQYSIGVIYSYIDYVKLLKEEFDEALKYARSSMEIQDRLWSSEKTNTLYRDGKINAHFWLGITLRDAGRIQEGLAEIQKSLDLQKAVFEADKSNAGQQNSLGDAYFDLAKTFAKDKEWTKANKNFQEAISNYQMVFANDSANLAVKRQIAISQMGLADILLEQNDKVKAVSFYNQSLETLKNLNLADPNNTEWQHDLANCYTQLGKALMQTSEKSAATENFVKALPMMEKLSADSPENAIIRRELQSLKNDLAKFRQS